jgi:divalent metal cation (Fe/Co/Zn/Cd) transporter
MNKAGLVILVIGFLFTVSTGMSFITRKKVIDVGEIQITRDKKHHLVWSPLLGVVLMAAGGGIMLYAAKK